MAPPADTREAEARHPGRSAAAPAASPSSAARLSPSRCETRCAESARHLLGDFSPALLLLASGERRRARALLAYAARLFAAAVGEAAGDPEQKVELCERELDAVFAGGKPTDAVLARMAEEDRSRRWPADALGQLADAARRSALGGARETAEEADAEARGAARAVATALLGPRMNTDVAVFGGALLSLAALLRVDPVRPPLYCPIPQAELRAWLDAPGRGGEAVRRAAARLRPRLLRAPRGLLELPAAYRRAGVFCLHTALRLLSDLEGASPSRHAGRRLGPLTRITFLARARWRSIS
jgi:hypothetical protein